MKIKRLELFGLWLARKFGTPRETEEVLLLKHGHIHPPPMGSSLAFELGCTCGVKSDESSIVGGVGDFIGAADFLACPIHYMPLVKKVYIRIGTSGPAFGKPPEVDGAFCDTLVEYVKNNA